MRCLSSSTSCWCPDLLLKLWKLVNRTPQQLEEIFRSGFLQNLIIFSTLFSGAEHSNLARFLETILTKDTVEGKGKEILKVQSCQGNNKLFLGVPLLSGGSVLEPVGRYGVRFTRPPFNIFDWNQLFQDEMLPSRLDVGEYIIPRRSCFLFFPE